MVSTHGRRSFLCVAGRVSHDCIFGIRSGVHDIEIDASEFAGSAGALSLGRDATPAPASRTHALPCDPDDGKPCFDADGDGARVHILTPYLAPTLVAGDIVLV